MIRSALGSLLVLAPQLPVRAAPPLLAPPPVVQRQGQAMLSGGALCPALQTALESAVGTEERLWSVSVVDQRGQLLAGEDPDSIKQQLSGVDRFLDGLRN